MPSPVSYRIHPSIGIGRVGNSLDAYYLAPDSIGGLPIEANAAGDPVVENGAPKRVTQFKDAQGRIKRQAATFAIYQSNPDGLGEVELDLTGELVESVVWSVHVANKKAAWWDFTPLLGDLMFGQYNSYETWQEPPDAWNVDGPVTGYRNPDVVGDAARKALIIDPGPRSVRGAGAAPVEFTAETVPPEYTHASFPPSDPGQGLPVKSLGEIRTDSRANLLVLGGFGHAGGDESITGFGGGNTWHDDIADGPVTATITFKDQSVVTLSAWVVIGSPKFAPELVNVSTWDDVALDCALKYQGARPDVYDLARWPGSAGWNPEYQVNYWEDIKPFLNRMADYQWVATVPSMTAFINPPFDPNDTSERAQEQRAQFLSYFRQPPARRDATLEQAAGFIDGQNQQLFSSGLQETSGIPLVPMNSGSNSVRNNVIDKFSVLTDTQYFLLKQWAAGHFSPTAPALRIPNVHPLDQAGIGNCVGEPMCPGIEVTWSVRNPTVYSAPYQIRHRHDEAYYYQHGLSWSEDETAPVDWSAPTVGAGCEPGDLTKRMAIPWQADFFDCSVQFINFDNPNEVKNPATMIPTPPTYYSYWWPPQSPWNVIGGGYTAEEQRLTGVPAGMQVMYSRGVNSFTQMITAWKYLGFVANQNHDPASGRAYPYFAEQERNHGRFHMASVAVGNVTSFVTGDDSNFYPAWFLKDEDPAPQTREGDKPRKILTLSHARTGRR
ncbi:hypothetical protein HF313_05330 [Massilia atriviolacea]|uniref:CTQ-dependent lysine 6-oxidase LodA n=1 Tax=Massilia atriviolacea TaxID=2495579 RepID=UPI0013DF0B01|nr:CTQ-dependent lysine 6-oxidase LodA [Massilia atriviolacea]